MNKIKLCLIIANIILCAVMYFDKEYGLAFGNGCFASFLIGWSNIKR